MNRWRPITSVAWGVITAAGLLSGGASAQTANIPLPPGWAAVPFANGCAFANTGTRKTEAVLHWYGGCRFGLAHGDGYSRQSSGPSGQRRYYYGVPLGTASEFGLQAPYFYRSNDGYDLSMTDEAGQRYWVHIQRPDLNVSSIVAGYVVSVTGRDGSTIVVDAFTPKPLVCTAQGKADWKGLTVSAADSAAADASCTRTLSKGRSSAIGVMVGLGGSEVSYIEHVHWTRPDGGVISPKEVTGRYCSGGAKSADCTRVLREMLQPYAVRIQAVIDGQRRQYAEGLPWLAQRFAPLETALRQKVGTIAERYTVPRSTKTRSPARKGTSN